MSATNPHNQSPPIVLVTDDDRDLVHILMRFLSQQGMIVIPAYSGRQCLEIIRQGTPIDALILDLEMPEIGGLEVCAALKATAPAVPIIVLTAKDNLETRLAAMRSGASEFMLKPVRGQELLARVRTQIEVSQRFRDVEQALTVAEGAPVSKKKVATTFLSPISMKKRKAVELRPQEL